MPPILPLSKCLDLTDLARFSPPVRQLLETPSLLANQHDARRWEYGIACEAISRWQTAQQFAGGGGLAAGTLTLRPEPLEILDAGAATSNLWKALRQFTILPITRVDPYLIAPEEDVTRPVRTDLQRYGEFAAVVDSGLPTTVDVLTCISVIEHIPDAEVLPFCRVAHALLRPGGLFILTTDYRDVEGPDTAHFHWMRERIYTPETLTALFRALQDLGFVPFDAVDYTYPGPQVYDYSFASVVMTKGERS